ncbi:MAG TPA: nucleotidyltransferase domain-containing protein [archaeon]|nr:nucleotidyltransferase domain-containing protein [archaeon]
MDIYKINFTVLQQEILRFLFIRPGTTFTERSLAKNLKVSPTAVSNAIEILKRQELIIVKKDEESGRLSISLNRDNDRIFSMKRVENLRFIYESGFADYISEKFPGCTVIVFGSYSFGEDTKGSDIDIAVIGSSKKTLDTEKFNKILERNISLNFYDSLGEIKKPLKENILNGIVINGGIQL